MEFITENHYKIDSSFIWMQKTLDLLSGTATLEQLAHILNGYAELYKLQITFIQVHGYNLVKKTDIQEFYGIPNSDEQQHRPKKISYVMCNTEQKSFGVFYAHGSNGLPQVIFAQDDEKISDDIAELLKGWNRESNATTI